MADLPFTQIPTHWRLERLDHLFRVVKEPARIDDPPVSAFIDGVVTLRSNRPDAMIKGSGQEIGYKHIEAGDLVISGMNAHLGGLGISDSSGKCTPVYTVMRKTTDLDQRFISYYLWHAAQSGYIKSLVNAVRYNSADFGPETVKRFMVPVPPLEEQRRIADYLDEQVARFDEILVTKRNYIKIIGELYLRLIAQITSGLGGDMKALLPGWQVQRISWNFKTGSGTTPTSNANEFFDGTITWVNSGDLNDGLVTQSSKQVTELAIQSFSALKVYQPGALLVAMYGATVGKTALLGVPACVNQAVCVLEPIGAVLPEYARYWFFANRSALVEQSVGGGQPNINQDILRSQRIPFPDLDTQARLVTQLNDETQKHLKMTLLVEQSVDRIIALKTSLITAAVTGTFDVTTGRSAA